jgi:hypothetical protein
VFVVSGDLLVGQKLVNDFIKNKLGDRNTTSIILDKKSYGLKYDIFILNVSPVYNQEIMEYYPKYKQKYIPDEYNPVSMIRITNARRTKIWEKTLNDCIRRYDFRIGMVKNKYIFALMDNKTKDFYDEGVNGRFKIDPYYAKQNSIVDETTYKYNGKIIRFYLAVNTNFIKETQINNGKYIKKLSKNASYSFPERFDKFLNRVSGDNTKVVSNVSDKIIKLIDIVSIDYLLGTYYSLKKEYWNDERIIPVLKASIYRKYEKSGIVVTEFDKNYYDTKAKYLALDFVRNILLNKF